MSPNDGHLNMEFKLFVKFGSNGVYFELSMAKTAPGFKLSIELKQCLSR